MPKAIVGFLIGAVLAGVVVYLMMTPGQPPEEEVAQVQTESQTAQSRPVGPVMIHIVRNGQAPTEIFVTPPFRGICGQMKRNKVGGLGKRVCEADEVRWRLAGQLEPDETLTIENVQGENVCFENIPQDGSLQIEDHTQVYSSGEVTCPAAEFGTYWPYLLKLTWNGQEIESDPGAIIFP